MSARPRATASPLPTGEADPHVSSGVLVALVNAWGVIDERTVGPFARELASAVKAGAIRLLVDLSRADDLATSCLNTLLAARQQVLGRGGRIAVVLSPAMRRRFEALGLDRRFLVADDRLQAARLLGLVDGGASGAGSPRPHARAA
jgi:anti-anti-sigma regulatory factor